MKFIKLSLVMVVLAAGSMWSCKDYLMKLNENPNGINPETANPNLVFASVLSATGMTLTNLGYGDFAGVMQHTQKDGWLNTHNEYRWDNNNSWTMYYDILRNNRFFYNRAVELKQEPQQGVALVMKSIVFGLITDLFGDAPYSMGVQADEGGKEYLFPAFDRQEDIYSGILADLEEANRLLSKPVSAEQNSLEGVDMYYKGDLSKWRKLANSLRLRYLMRISEKKPELAKAEIERMRAAPADYPLVTEAVDDCTMPSWTPVYDVTESNYRRVKMCATLVEVMREGKDPRLGVWAKKVEIPLVVRDSLPAGTDRIINGKRYISPDVLAAKNIALSSINQNTDYVGLPPAYDAPSTYNLSPDANQASFNPHVSWLSDMYRVFNSPLLKSRILSAAEVNFILAEAAWKGWSVGGTAADYYNAGVKASMEAWGVGDAYASFILHPTVAYNGTQKQIIVQKWVASWQAAVESWADYKRTGYPELKAGPNALRPVLPVRLYYMIDERNLNNVNAEKAMKNLEVTSYSGPDGENSAWSKPWVLQGTGKPW